MLVLGTADDLLVDLLSDFVYELISCVSDWSCLQKGGDKHCVVCFNVQSSLRSVVVEVTYGM